MLPETTELQSLLNRVGASKTLLSQEDKDIAMSLVRKGADAATCAKTLDYKTLLHHLIAANKAGCNNAEIIELVEKYTPVDVRDGYGCSALMSLIDQFQKKQCSFADFKKTAMLLANHNANLSLAGTVEPCQTLIHYLVLTNKDGINNPELVQLFEKNKALVDVRAGYKYSALTSLMDQWQKTQRNWEDFKKTAMLLAQYGADLSVCSSIAPHKTLLHYLVLNNQDGANNKEITELLLLQKGLMSLPDGNGNLPLHTILLSEDNAPVSLIERLVVFAGKNVLSYNTVDGATLLHTSCRARNLEVVKYLLSQNLDVAAKTKSGNTALHDSVSHKDGLIWQCLFDNEADVNAANNAGQTALHLAAHHNNKAMVEWLVKHHAFLYTLDAQGKTALAIAQDKGNKEIAELLLAAQNTPVGQLFAAINQVKQYGEFLKNKASPKGQVAIDLAAELWLQAEVFFKQDPGTSTTALPEFKMKFTQLLNSKNSEMSQYRTSWSSIIANVALTLTGIGALLTIGHLIYSKATTGRALFFFQKPRTTCEENLDEVQRLVEPLSQ